MGFTLACLVSFAQFELRETDSDQLITNGETIAFSETGSNYSADYNWKFKVVNTSANDIYMRIFVDNMTNTDGSNYQLCFAGVCLNSISTGSGYPSTAALIPAGATNVAGNSLWNQHASGTTDAMSWTFRYQAFDAGGAEIGTPLIINYSFEPTLGVEESQLSAIKVYPTTVMNALNVSANEDLTANFYDLLGRNVKNATIVSGGDTIDTSDLSAQPYIIRFTNEEGESITKKIIKQ